MMNDKKRDRNSRQSNPPTPDRSNTQRRKTDGSNDTKMGTRVEELAEKVQAVIVGNNNTSSAHKKLKDHTDLLVEPPFFDGDISPETQEYRSLSATIKKAGLPFGPDQIWGEEKHTFHSMAQARGEIHPCLTSKGRPSSQKLGGNF